MAPGAYIPGYEPPDDQKVGSWREQAAIGLVFVLSHLSKLAEQRPADEEAADKTRAALSSLIGELGKPAKPSKPGKGPAPLSRLRGPEGEAG